MIKEHPTLTLEGVSEQSELLEIRYSGVIPDRAGAIVRLDEIARKLSAVASHGGFWGGGSPASRSVIEVRSPAVLELDAIVQSLNVAQLDPPAFQCLRQMVACLQKDDINIDKISVVDHGALPTKPVSFGWPDEDNEVQMYPQLSPELKPVLQFESGDFSKSRRILIELDRSINPVTMVEFQSWVEPWYGLLEGSAFSMPVGLPQETDSLAGQVSQFDDVTVEVSVDRFFASEQAWLVLANMTGAFWRLHAVIESITVD